LIIVNKDSEIIASDKEVAPVVSRNTPEPGPRRDGFMANTTIAQPGQEPQTRIERGCELYRVHGDDIVFAGDVWLVPSQYDATSVYEVTLGSRGEYCECKDFEYRSPAGGCVHIIAATLRKAKTFRCEGCGERFPNSEFFEAPEDHLTWFEGDPLCRECAANHGVL
jgi:hypothetical protein